jgi:hypothetical protein
VTPAPLPFDLASITRRSRAAQRARVRKAYGTNGLGTTPAGLTRPDAETIATLAPMPGIAEHWPTVESVAQRQYENVGVWATWLWLASARAGDTEHASRRLFEIYDKSAEWFMLAHGGPWPTIYAEGRGRRAVDVASDLETTLGALRSSTNSAS